ncbi:MAG: DUF2779 domain-containing protein [Thermoanaerobaculia bacterium]
MLSKSRYLAGRQCFKRLWIEANRRELVPPVDAATKAVFDQGHEVGRLAQQLFPGGMEITGGRFRWMEAAAKTRDALAWRLPLYEATFVAGGAGGAGEGGGDADVGCRVDILVPVDDDGGEAGSAGAWDLYEVKSGTSARDENVEDLALQAWIVRSAGLRVRRTSLVHLSSDYVREGALDLRRLFTVVDLGEQVAALAREIPQRVAELVAVAALPAEPEIAIGPHCKAPHTCPLLPYCWGERPEHDLLDLRRGGQRMWQLYGSGVRDLRSLPATAELQADQRIQVEAARTGEAHVNRAAIASFLEQLPYPRLFLDFETFASAVPPFDGTRPYQQIPFQFSLHRLEEEGAAPRADAWLAPDGDDPRAGFLAALRAAIGELDAAAGGGPPPAILVYNASFERRVLAETAAHFPEHVEWAARVTGRLVDLLDPFARFDYYHPAQRGSASLKRVLPVLGDRGYDELEIQEGQLAAREFVRSNAPGTTAAERESIRRALLDYCARDTAGMIEIVAALERLVAERG